MMAKYLRISIISVIIFTFITCSETEEIDATLPSAHINWHNLSFCNEGDLDYDLYEPKNCWKERKADCENATTEGCTPEKIFEQKTYGCFSCPSGGWIPDDEGWSLCQSRNCNHAATKERKYRCGDYSTCHLNETAFCTPLVTCNGTYGNWEVIRECETCTQGDIKVLRKQCRYNGKLNTQCSNHNYHAITKNVVCLPSDCKKENNKLEIEWGEWSVCSSHDQANQPTRSRKCIKNCPTTTSQILEVELCPDIDKSFHKAGVRPMLECDCFPKIVTIALIICSLVSSTGCCVFGCLCFRRRRRKQSKKLNAENEEENIYEERDA